MRQYWGNMPGQVESYHKLEKEQLGLEDGEERYCCVGCARSSRPRDDFHFISEKFCSRNDFSSTNEKTIKKRAIYLAVIRTTNDTENEDTEIDPNTADSVK